MSTRKASFAPVVRADCRLLLLGSLPGDRSLAERRYYAHPQNRFWHLVGGVIDNDLVSLPYEHRLAALLDHRIGLWDTVREALREGSLDARIRDAAPNALAGLVATLPDLRAIGLNGAAAARFATRALGDHPVDLVPLPSSSPAHAAMPLAEKARLWGTLRKYLA